MKTSGPLFLRADAGDTVILASQSLADYLGVPKASLVGLSLDSVAGIATGELRDCFRRAEGGRRLDQLVVDGFSRVFEAKTWSEGGVFDVLLDEVTSIQPMLDDLREASAIPTDDLTEEELATVRRPDRRTVSVLSARLVNFSEFVARTTPIEARVVVGSFTDEAASAIPAFGGVRFARSEEFYGGIFGAPRSFADHALRAVSAGLRLCAAMEALRVASRGAGREFPRVACGIATGECLVGTFGASGTARYSALGAGPDIAQQLVRLAQPGEILVTETCLRQILARLPQGWTSEEFVADEAPDMSRFRWSGDEVEPLPEDMRARGFALRPADSDAPSLVFRFVWCLKSADGSEPVPVLRVESPGALDGNPAVSDAREESSFIQIFGKYRLVELVGSGGMGKVWKARDRFGNTVALKTLQESGTQKPDQVRRFRREAEIMSRLAHRNICRIYEAGEFEGIQYLTMEFVDGLSLADLLAGAGRRTAVPSDLRTIIRKIRSGIASARTRDDPGSDGADDARKADSERILLPVEHALSLFVKVCEAVQFAHEHGVLHRDLKPANILLREDGEPLVADFGLAKLTGLHEEHSISVSGHVLGTLANMAPEQAESSKDVDERADIYSLGTILYVLMTGKIHFKTSGNFFADVQRLKAHTPPSARSVNPHVDPDMDLIIAKCLRPNPQRRYRNVRSLVKDLSLYRRGEPVTARRVPPGEMVLRWTKRYRGATLGGLAALLLVGGTGFGIRALGETARKAEAAELGQRASKAEAARAELEKQLARRDHEADVSKRVKDANLRAEQKIAAAHAEADAQRTARENADAKLRAAETALAESERLLANEKKLRAEAASRAAAAPAAAEKPKDDPKSPGVRAQELAGAATSGIAGLIGWAKPAEQPTGQPAEPLPANPAPAPDVRQAADIAKAGVYLDLSSRVLRDELDRRKLAGFEQKPSEVVGRIAKGIEFASQALLKDFSCARAWMLKGRYHLACLEIAQAERAFDMAARAPALRKDEGKPPDEPREDPAEMILIARQLNQPSGDLIGSAMRLLAKTDSPENAPVAEILGFFRNKPAISPTLRAQTSTNSRSKSPDEQLVNFIADNGERGKVEVLAPDRNSSPESLAISGIKEILNFKSLGQFKLKSLKISDATSLGWEDLAGFPLVSLTLENCRVSDMPGKNRTFRDLRTLSLRDAPIPDLAFVSRMPALESLDISGTPVTSLTPLDSCTKLTSLDASRVAIATIGKLPPRLARLAISPEMIAPDALNKLRATATIRLLSSPADPDPRPARVFWEKWDTIRSAAERKP
jgi:serine/threonine protein kinase/class 3 adenylate cyclase